LKHAGKEDLAHLATLAGVAIVLIWVIQLLGTLFSEVQSVFKLF
jgi:stage III sporulation protein AC